jgi:hypothetical protein
MALRATINGDPYDNLSGWSISEYATPVSPAERSGGTGGASMGLARSDGSIFLSDKSSVIDHDVLGDFAGTIRSVTEGNLACSVSQDTLLAKYDAQRVIPGMESGSVVGALDLVNQLIDTIRLDGGSGAFHSLAGHTRGFDNAGQMIDQVETSTTYQVYNQTLATTITNTAALYQNSVYADAYVGLGSSVYASGVEGSSFQWALADPSLFPNREFGGVILPTPILITGNSYTKMRLMLKSRLNGGNFTWAVDGLPFGGADQDYGMSLSATINYATEILTLTANYRSGGVPGTITTSNFSLAALDLDSEICIAIGLRMEGAGMPYVHRLATYVVNTSNYSVNAGGSITFTPDLQSVWFDPWTIQGNARSLWARYNISVESGDPDPFTPASLAEYEFPQGFTVDGTPSPGEPVISRDVNCWEYLQDACAAYRWEIAFDGSGVVARPTGGRVVSLENFAPSPSLSLQSLASARSVDVVNQNAVAVRGSVVYEARDDDNRIITVNASESVTTTVQTNTSLTAVWQPRRTTTYTPGTGTYVVIDSTGLPIVASQWENYGGSLTVAISDVPGAIDVVLKGPDSEIPSTTAPYSVALSDGQNQYATLSIIGSGIESNPETINILTGASPDKVTKEVGLTIDSPFLGSASRAYDAAAWAIVDISGPRITLSVTPSSDSFSGFGLAPGSIIQYRDSAYRVISATWNRLSVTLECVRHVTVGDFDAEWSGENVGTFDAFWTDYVNGDLKVSPLRR